MPVVHCVRHGQGLHNVAGMYSLKDPILTAMGESQCVNLRNSCFHGQHNVAIVISSPLCRALQTASIVFEGILAAVPGQPLKITALPDAQETSDDACDTGTDPAKLKAIVEEHGWPVDLSLIEEGWNHKRLDSRYSPQSNRIKIRARDARKFIAHRLRELTASGNADAEVALVSHGSFLHFFTDDWADADEFPATGWRNCEKRSYTFEHDFHTDADPEFRLIETEDSRRARGKPGPAASRDEQPELFCLAMESWGRAGLQRPDLVGTSLETPIAQQ